MCGRVFPSSASSFLSPGQENVRRSIRRLGRGSRGAGAARETISDDCDPGALSGYPGPTLGGVEGGRVQERRLLLERTTTGRLRRLRIAEGEAAMSPGKPEYVSDLLGYLRDRLGREDVTLNPGATTRGMHESLVTYGGKGS